VPVSNGPPTCSVESVHLRQKKHPPDTAFNRIVVKFSNRDFCNPGTAGQNICNVDSAHWRRG